ncbi:hypothetical protein C7271_20145 [filamentous cyanobacterium CCP5]|nr:hypothetical protein C7271_20145 [filamentous cyanobacterium CCP5]
MLALATMLITPNLPSESAAGQADLCQQQVQPQSFLSRDQLSKLLEIPEQSSKATIQEAIAEPYCIMAPSSYREGVPAQREAYPLEFDPSTWLIVLYENEEYAGYDFSFRR